MLLSILIPTLPERRSYLNGILGQLNAQLNGYGGMIEILTDDRPKNIPTGTKRNDLKNKCSGVYFAFIDDDDRISGDYIAEIIKATETLPDVITFDGQMTTDGGQPQDFYIHLGSDYAFRNNCYYRYPNHICVWKKQTVGHVNFPHTWKQEDYNWATAIRNRMLAKTTVHIPKKLYFYEFKTKK